ncbi:MAG: nuclear transport factor 2 family protein [Betaproteobacteria bacterium]|nr:nuclear transport factor 2 family protein [Betaproteobacteria bacterium]
MNRSPQLQRTVAFWETMTRDALAGIATVYTEDVRFRDPFNDIAGIDKLSHICADMFVRLDEPRFRILDTIEQGDRAFLTWDFTFRIRALKPGLTRTIHGGTHLTFAPDGRVCVHRDYWDAAGELYEQLPVVGALMRFLKKRAG